MSSLIDRWGRKHNYLRVSLTERCNLRCSYCMPEEGVQLSERSHLMHADEIEDISRVFTNMGVDKIRLTGGEPLVRKDAPAIIERLSKLPVELTLTTNGILVDRFIDLFKSTGIKSLNISLDTLSPERFALITKRNEYHRVRQNIGLLLDEGFHVKINVVLMKDMNEDEIEGFVDWSANENVHIRFIEFMPFDRNGWAWDRIIPYASIVEKIKKRSEIVKLNDKPNDTAKAWQIKNGTGTFAVISSMTDHFCNTCNRLRLTADGKLRNCLFSDGEVDLLTAWRNGIQPESLIAESLARKEKRHGGIAELQKLANNPEDISRRSMILIGG